MDFKIGEQYKFTVLDDLVMHYPGWSLRCAGKYLYGNLDEPDEIVILENASGRHLYFVWSGHVKDYGAIYTFMGSFDTPEGQL